MKQQTIDLIKSMTEQGFLVIVDPEIYNGNETTVVISEKQEEERNPESRVIFTNCVGEVFTEEDVDNKMIVWYADISQGDKTINTYYANIAIFDAKEFKSRGRLTDIFRSKKSLLKYLYETCD